MQQDGKDNPAASAGLAGKMLDTRDKCPELDTGKNSVRPCDNPPAKLRPTYDISKFPSVLLCSHVRGLVQLSVFFGFVCSAVPGAKPAGY